MVNDRVKELEKVVNCVYRECNQPIKEGVAYIGVGGSYNGFYFCSTGCLLRESLAHFKGNHSEEGIPVKEIIIKYRDTIPSP